MPVVMELAVEIATLETQYAVGYGVLLSPGEVLPDNLDKVRQRHHGS